MRRFVSSAALVLTLASGIWLVDGAVPARAQADPIGGLLIIPGSGNDLTPIRLRTSAGCPAEASAYYARMKGQGFPPDGLVVTANTAAGMSHSFGFDVYLALIMRDFANDNHTTLGGRYDITVFCVHRLTLQSYGEFTGSLEFTSPTYYEALGAAKPTEPPPPPLDLDGDGFLDLNSDGSAADGYVTAPPAGTPPEAGPIPGAAEGASAGEGLPAPTPTAPLPAGDAAQPPVVADTQLSSQPDEAPKPRLPWVILGFAALLTPVAVVTVNRLRRWRAR